MRPHVFYGILPGIFLFISGGTAVGQEFRIYADSYPVSFFAEQIAGGVADVILPLPDDADPTLWTPSIDLIAEYQQADIILLNGADLAPWTTRTTLPRQRTVYTDAAFAGAVIHTEGVTHSHGPDGEHTHSATAPFTWLDFELAEQQAATIAEALRDHLPDHAETFDANLSALQQALSELEEQSVVLGDLAGGSTLLASHPVYQYFARAYGFEITSLAWEPDTPPTTEQLAELDSVLQSEPSTIMLLETDPTPETAEALAGRGLTGVVFETAANRPDSEDFIATMQANLSRLQAAIAGL